MSNDYIISRIISFANDYREILAITLENDFENKDPVYYFLVGTPHNGVRADAISELELELTRQFPERKFSLMEWPCSNLGDHLGKVLWKK